MLKSLRRKFVAIIMALVGIVLVSVVGGSYLSSRQTQRELVNEALERNLVGSVYDFPRIGGPFMDDREDQPDHGRANVLILAIDLDSSGMVLATNNAPVIIDSTALSNLLASILQSDANSMWDESSHIAWMREQRTSGSWRVVIADTSAVDVSLHSLMVKDIAIIAAAMGVLLVIALFLSTWVLKPVEAAWKQQRQFIADASHELKTPLAVIIANTQILQADKAIPTESMRWVQSTADESAHMKSLVEELLELARTDETTAGAKDVMRSEAVDFSTMVENAALEFDAIAFERGSLIEQSVDEGVCVQGDPEWLGRLCKILIDNACKYSSPGSPVRVELHRENKRCTLSVNNQGNVIDPADLPHVFDRFYRTDKARSRDAHTGGFGLGLAIAKGICTSHGGNISVQSNETEGTTFVVTLPTQS